MVGRLVVVVVVMIIGVTHIGDVLRFGCKFSLVRFCIMWRAVNAVDDDDDDDGLFLEQDIPLMILA